MSLKRGEEYSQDLRDQVLAASGPIREVSEHVLCVKGRRSWCFGRMASRCSTASGARNARWRRHRIGIRPETDEIANSLP